jgi:hypothetical protein
MSSTNESDSRFARAVAAFKHANAADPTTVLDGDRQRPRELVDAERLAVWVERLEPNASEALRLAAHCQHLRRWEVPRSSYETGRIGYLKWRKTLARFHADEAAKILRAAGYAEDTIERVRRINTKQELQRDPEVQTMEDALCLSFLEHELAEFSARHPRPKTLEILAKTWGKMSEKGHAAARALALPAPSAALLEAALELARRSTEGGDE